MTNEEGVLKTSLEIAKTIPELYTDVAKPTTQATGDLVSLLPRTINAALAPLRKWILHREYNIKETQCLLEKKLAAIDPGKIVSPEPYVAVPALEALSYAMDNATLRDLYANLLAKAMIIDTKDQVHPAYLECIKQLSPIDAENLAYWFSYEVLPIAQYVGTLFPDGYRIFQSSVFLANEKRNNISQQAISIDALSRIGLIKLDYSYQMRNTANYQAFSNTPLYLELQAKHVSPAPSDGFQDPRDQGKITNIEIKKGIATTTEFGKQFCSTCIA